MLEIVSHFFCLFVCICYHYLQEDDWMCNCDVFCTYEVSSDSVRTKVVAVWLILIEICTFHWNKKKAISFYRWISVFICFSIRAMSCLLDSLVFYWHIPLLVSRNWAQNSKKRHHPSCPLCPFFFFPRKRFNHPETVYPPKFQGNHCLYENIQIVLYSSLATAILHSTRDLHNILPS